MITILTGVSSTLVSALEIARVSMSKVSSWMLGDFCFRAVSQVALQAST